METDGDTSAQLVEHAKRQTAALESLRQMVWMWSALTGLAIVVALLAFLLNR